MGKIKALNLKNFSGFSDIDHQFSSGINVFIGEKRNRKDPFNENNAFPIKSALQKGRF